MNNFKGTPGEWKLSAKPDMHGDLGITQSGYRVATVHERNAADQQKANALVITEAPEMLAVLVECKDFVDYLANTGNVAADATHKRVCAILAALRAGGAL